MAAGLVISIEKNLNWLKCKKKKNGKGKIPGEKANRDKEKNI